MKTFSLIIILLDLLIGLILLRGILRKNFDKTGNLGAGAMCCLLIISGLLLVAKL